MNLESINKWLDNEFGVSYTRLEELHDFYFEKYTEQKEEINRLNNIMSELEKWLEEQDDEHYSWHYREWIKQVLNKLKELKGDKNE